MKDNTSAAKPSLTDQLRGVGQMLARYVVLWFVLLLVVVYGYVAFRVVMAHEARPNEADVSAEVQATATPHIDQQSIAQLQSLQDHNVNVQTLFDAARSNPFKE